jgi:uncharacterized protein (DUF433 family)
VNVAESRSDKLWGTPVFTGTRVPVQTVFDYIMDDHTIEEFLADFPEVQQDQVSALIEAAARLSIDQFRKTA